MRDDVVRGDKEGPASADRADNGPSPRATVRALDAVRFGRAKLVHARSYFRPDESACGVGGIWGPGPTRTDEPVGCKDCLRISAIRRPRA